MEDKLKANISELIEILKWSDCTKFRALIGLDGFVDEVVHVVDKRSNAFEYTKIRTMRDYGERIIKASGLSTNVEMVTIKTKIGGNGPIMANSLLAYGVNITCMGALGEPNIHPIFLPMNEKAKIISIANPSHTDAVEFEDGKIISSKLEAFKDLNWNKIKEKVGLDTLISIFENSDMISLNNWTMIPHMNDIWENIIKKVLPAMKRINKGYMFFDLADPEKRKKEDILEALSHIKKFNSYFKVILGLNKKESHEIARVLDFSNKVINENLEKLIMKLSERLCIHCLIIHPVDEAVGFSEGIFFHTPGPYINNPKLTTGAGDNFNAGFCLGQLLELPVELSLLLGTATSGFYVRNAKSPTFLDIIEFLNSWKENKL